MICLTSLLDLPRGCAHRPKGPNRLVMMSPLPPKFFMNPKCPPVPAAIKATTAKVHHSESLHMGQQARYYFWALTLANRLRGAAMLRHVPVG